MSDRYDAYDAWDVWAEYWECQYDAWLEVNAQLERVGYLQGEVIA